MKNIRRKASVWFCWRILAGLPASQGISTFETDVPFRREPIHAPDLQFWFHVTKISEKNVSHIIIPIVATKKSIHKEEEEQRLATIASLKSILYPKSIAVVGASRNPGTIGYNLVRALIQSGYVGAVYPVNPNIEVVSSIKTYPLRNGYSRGSGDGDHRGSRAGSIKSSGRMRSKRRKRF